MKLFRLAALVSLLFASPAFAQWQVPDHSIPIGQGANKQGFRFVAPGTIDLPLVSNGASADPSFRALPPAAFPVFTGDVPPAAGALGVVPAPPSGSTAANRTLGANASWVDRKPLSRFVQPAFFAGLTTLPQFNAVAPLTIVGGTAGLNTVTMTTTPADVYHNITRAVQLNSNTSYVDPVLGSDANSPACAKATPCLTFDVCFANCTSNNIVGVTSGPFNPFSWNGSTSARPWHRLTFDGAATFFVNGANYIEAPAMTFVASGNIWVANLPLLPNGATIQRVTYSDTYDPGTGNLTRFPLFASQAALNTAAGAAPLSTFGWFPDTAPASPAKNLYVAFFGNNVNTNKAKLRVYYTLPNADAAISIVGGANLLLDVTYPLFLDGVSIEGSNSGASTPTILIEGRNLIRQFVPLGNGIHSDGGFVYVSGWNCQASSFDCFNWGPSLGTGTAAMAIGHNVTGWYAGDTATFGTGLAMNRNGWSAHGGVNDIIAGASFGQNWGPNIANTTFPGYSAGSWFVGVETVKSADGIDPGIGIYGDALQPTGLRSVWIDTCTTIDEADSLHVEQVTVTVKQTFCALNKPYSSVGGAVVNNYVRSAP